MAESIPQTNPGAGYLADRREFDDAWRRVMERGWYILGKEVAEFEREFAEYLGAAEVVGTANGTDALCLALRAAGVRPGERVFTVSHTAVATLAAILMAQARPVFVDIDPAMFTMSPVSLEDAIRRAKQAPNSEGRLSAVVVVHLYGQPADMPSIIEIARRNGLSVIEDCAQSHGATLAGRKSGTWGDIAAFSFYPTKNLGAFGDGGAIAVGTATQASRCRSMREYGWDRERVSQEQGVNSRLDELHAALLRVRLRHLDRDNAARGSIAAIYNERLANTKITCPAVRPGAVHAYHQYVIRSPRRGALRTELDRAGIGTGIHYTPPAHQHPAFHRFLDDGIPLPETEHAANEIVSLPMYPQMTAAQANKVADEIIRFGTSA